MRVNVFETFARHSCKCQTVFKEHQGGLSFIVTYFGLGEAILPVAVSSEVLRSVAFVLKETDTVSDRQMVNKVVANMKHELLFYITHDGTFNPNSISMST
jgi:hypothetical protein